MRRSRKLFLLSFFHTLLWLQLVACVGLNMFQYNTQFTSCVEQTDLSSDYSSDCEDNTLSAEESEIKLLPHSAPHFYSIFSIPIQTRTTDRIQSYCVFHHSLTPNDILTPPPQFQL